MADLRKFKYKAIATAGSASEGVIEAVSKEEALGRLMKTGVRPVKLEAVSVSLLDKLRDVLLTQKHLGAKDVLRFTDEMANLLKAGLSVDRALSIIHSTTPGTFQAEAILRVMKRVREGQTLHKALAAEPLSFPAFYAGMIQAGELSGSLSGVFEDLSRFLSERSKALDQVRSAMIYPLFLLAMLIFTLVLVTTVVLPQFQPIFDQAPHGIPLATQIVMTFGAILRQWGVVLILLFLVLIVVGREALKREGYRLRFDQWLYHTFWTFGLVQKAEVSRFQRLMSTLLACGVPLPRAFKISMGTITNTYFLKNIVLLLSRLKEGGRLSSLYNSVQVFPFHATQMMRVGEETGDLPKMMRESAEALDRDIKLTVDRLLSLMVPLLTVVMGLIVASFVGATLVGILSVNDIAF
jgi:general secretion pathway protein F